MFVRDSFELLTFDGMEIIPAKKATQKIFRADFSKG